MCLASLASGAWAVSDRLAWRASEICGQERVGDAQSAPVADGESTARDLDGAEVAQAAAAAEAFAEGEGVARHDVERQVAPATRAAKRFGLRWTRLYRLTR